MEVKRSGERNSSEMCEGVKLGIVINTNDAETVWNAFRLGNVALRNNMP